MKREESPTACQHCGALVFPETKSCPQCGKFPVRLHKCPRCNLIAPPHADHCETCGRVFLPGEDYL
jgi:RNA polymerase subunit RPABC4/transcription elongation factor Spt4